jgi:hypothetical protein
MVGQNFLPAPDTPSIQRRHVDPRFGRTIGEVGRFGPRKVAKGPQLDRWLAGAVARRRPFVAYPTVAFAPSFAIASATYVVDAANREVATGAIQNTFESAELGDRLDARVRTLVVETFPPSAYTTLSYRFLSRFGVRFSVRQSSS